MASFAHIAHPARPSTPLPPQFQIDPDTWRPLPPVEGSGLTVSVQAQALARTEQIILFGGARGPGKTEAEIVWMAIPAGLKDPRGRLLHPYYKGLVLRRNAKDLEDFIDRADKIYSRLGARLLQNPVKHWRFPGGPVIRTGHLNNRKSYELYMGQELHRIGIEEITHIPDENLLWNLLASNRSVHPTLPAQAFLTTNPTGPGSAWVKQHFVHVRDSFTGQLIPFGHPFYAWKHHTDKGPQWFFSISKPKPINGREIEATTRIFIPSTLFDNPILLENDPSYLAKLEQLPENHRRAWIYGDWDATTGVFFPQLRLEGPIGGESPNASHCIPASEARLHPWYQRWMSLDWGRAHRSVVLKYCAEPIQEGRRDRIHAYDEIVTQGQSATVLGKEIAESCKAEFEYMRPPTLVCFCDPKITMQHSDATILSQIQQGIDEVLGKGTAIDGFNKTAGAAPDDPNYDRPHIILVPAYNSRVDGWQIVHEFLRWERHVTEDDDVILPKLLIHEHLDVLKESLRTLEIDETNPEDALKADGDDAADSLRYGLCGYRFRAVDPPVSVRRAEIVRALLLIHPNPNTSEFQTALYQAMGKLDRKLAEEQQVKAASLGARYAPAASVVARAQLRKSLGLPQRPFRGSRGRL